MPDKPIILDLCGGTGAWSQPYREAGYDVHLITLPDYDVIVYNPPANVYGILAAPPCDLFASCAARWWKRWDSEYKLGLALNVVYACLRIVKQAKPVWWALENPVGRLRNWLGEPKFVFDPCDFGDPYTKRTLLWGEFKPPTRTPVTPVEGSKMHRLSPSAKRKELRATTPPGFARAFFEANR